MEGSRNVRALVTTWQKSGEAPSPLLLDAMYGELREIASAYLAREYGAHTLYPTDLVHEAWARLGSQEASPDDRAQFIGLAATMMRRVLVDHARAKRREKRGGGAKAFELDSRIPGDDDAKHIDLIALDDALHQLSALSTVQTQLVELRFFGGLSMADAASVLSISERTLHREWIMARTWLRRALS